MSECVWGGGVSECVLTTLYHTCLWVETQFNHNSNIWPTLTGGRALVRLNPMDLMSMRGVRVEV